MAISSNVSIEQQAIFTPQDLRDPLGVWGGRFGVTGDASGGGIKVAFNSPAEIQAGFVYTCYDAQMSFLSGSTGQPNGKIRLLTNWPNVDPQAGVQAFSTFLVFAMAFNSAFSSPTTGPNQSIVKTNQRFLPLYDPRSTGVDMDIVEMEIGENVLNAVYAIECWGYYWDRAVMQVPGGMRHPGSS